MKLEAGQFYGETRQSLITNKFRFSEQIYSAGAFFSPHSHELSHFCFALSGNYEEKIGARGYGRKSRSLIYYPPDTNHSEKHFSSGRHFLVEIDTRELERILDYGARLNEPVTLQSSSTLSLAAKMYREFIERDELSKLVLESLIPELLVATSRQNTGDSEKKSPKWLETVKEYLRKNCSNPPKLHEIAKIAGVHPTHLVRVFRQFEHRTVGDYIRMVRVEMACKKIVDTDQSLTEIALSLGFADQPHFNRTFRKEMNTTPGEFRRLLKAR